MCICKTVKCEPAELICTAATDSDRWSCDHAFIFIVNDKLLASWAKKICGSIYLFIKATIFGTHGIS